MAMNFEDLDETTRETMLLEFEVEQTGSNAYRGKALSSTGLAVFPRLMRDAIQRGNEVSLAMALTNPQLWLTMETYERNGVMRERRINVDQAAERLSITDLIPGTCAALLHGYEVKASNVAKCTERVNPSGNPLTAVRTRVKSTR